MQLGIVYTRQGRYSDAETALKPVLRSMKTALGEEHPDTADARLELAVVYAHQGRWKEAQELEERGLILARQVFGLKHPNTLSIEASLARMYHEQGRGKDASKFAAHVLENLDVYPDNHPERLRWMLHYYQTCRWARARSRM